MRLPPLFPSSEYRNGHAELARLVAPELDPQSVAELIGHRWTRLGVSGSAYYGAQDGPVWFAKGDPYFVAVSFGAEHVEVRTVRGDVEYLTSEDSESLVARLVNRPGAGLARALVVAISQAAERERSARTWCAMCGAFTARVDAGSEGLCESCFVAGRLGTVY